ncbi:uncharacterized protein LOC107632930 [Arachis ipaensis]|uniref:uncharacterized protein LOC107632930 n=1 Tax=Arachis ipaensis TaxID=130454 RepID=UPI0007AFB67F|nr:uncharacterized protein LOC107632930 [Arachis ipaensis]
MEAVDRVQRGNTHQGRPSDEVMKDQFVNMKLIGRNSLSWVLTTVYESPKKINRRGLWNNLKNISNNMELPWCVIENFNAFLHDLERKGSSGLRSQGACTEFQDCMFDRGLTDLGYDGWPFTWRRGNLVEWLDRGLGNITWQIRFSDAKIKHLSMLKSDNSPLCLQISTMPPPNRERIPFKFLASWLFHPDFSNVISNNWRMFGSWPLGFSILILVM